jgi:hypothetical protein
MPPSEKLPERLRDDTLLISSRENCDSTGDRPDSTVKGDPVRGVAAEEDVDATALSGTE